MKIYTFYTDSHKIFLKHFLNSFIFEEGLDLDIRYMPQECETGVYCSDGWNNTMQKKVQYIIDALNETKENEIIIHSDCDVVFFDKIKNVILQELGDFDIAAQIDWQNFCAGFFACRSNDKIKKMFEYVLENMQNFEHDQQCMNYYLKSELGKDIKKKFLSPKFFNHGFFGRHYKDEKVVNIPNDTIMFHANFAVGVESKLNLINSIKKI